MKYVQKRLMSIFAATVMGLCSVMPESFTAIAAETITKVVISGIKDPFVGEKPVNDPSAYQLDIPDQAEIKWAKWVDFDTMAVAEHKVSSLDEMENKGKFSSSSRTVPILCIGLDAKDGYQFSTSTAAFKDNSDSMDYRLRSDFAGKLNEWGLDYPECDLLVEYETYARNPLIKELIVSGIQKPQRGGTPALDGRAYSASEHARVKAFSWYTISGSSSVKMQEGDKFRQDQAKILMTIESEEGYGFSDSIKVSAPDISEGTLPDSSVYVMHDEEKDYLFLDLGFKLSSSETIKTVSISKLLAPASGEVPVTNPSYFRMASGSYCSVSKVIWYDSAKKEVFSGKFQEGSTYTAYIIVSPDPGYSFSYSDWSSKPEVTGKVNSADAVSFFGKNELLTDRTITDEMDDGDVCIEATFIAKSKTALSNPFTFSDLHEPVAQEYPVADLNMNTGMFSSYEILPVDWLDVAANHILGEDECFEANKTYTARITVVPQYGYSFDIKKLSGTINGKNCEIQTTKIKREDGAWVDCPVFCRSFTAPAFVGEDVYFTVGEKLTLTSPKITGKSGVNYTWTGNRYNRGGWTNGTEFGSYTDDDTDYKGSIDYQAIGGIATEPASHPKGMTKYYDGAWVECRAWTEQGGTLEIRRFHLHMRSAEVSHRITMRRPNINDKYDDIISSVSFGDFILNSENGDAVTVCEYNANHSLNRVMKNGDVFKPGYAYGFRFRLSLPDSALADALLDFFDHGLDFCEESAEDAGGEETGKVTVFWESPGAGMIDLDKKQIEDSWLSSVLYPDDPKKCGDNLTWGYTPGLELNGEQTGRMLIFSGSGDMYNYTAEQLSPWATDDYEVNQYVLDISFPEYLSHIGDYAFYQTGSLRTVQFSRNLKSIGASAFRDAAALESIEIPYNTKSVGMDAFRDCQELQEIIFWNPEIKIADSAETISQHGDFFSGTIVGFENSTAQDYAKKYNRKFRSLGAKPDGMCGDHLWWYLKDGTLTIMGEGDMYNGSQFGETPAEITALSLPEKLTGIGSYAFTDFGISEVTIPESVTKIGENAFTGAKNLVSVTVPKNVASVGAYAFFNTQLSDITFLNPDTAFPDNGQTFTNTFKTDKRPNEISYIFGGTVHGYANSTAQAYAEKYDFNFEPLEALPFTVSFDANGGSGSMDSIRAADGEKIVLPECGFTAPSGKVFKCWAVAEEALDPGAVLTVSSDLVVYAVWERPTRMRRGDVSDDETVDTADAMLLTRYVNGWEGITVDPAAADIDQDGRVDTRDAMLLTRYVNGWEGYNKYFAQDTP